VSFAAITFCVASQRVFVVVVVIVVYFVMGPVRKLLDTPRTCLQISLILSVLGPNILLCTLSSAIIKLCSSPRARHQFQCI